MEKIAFISGGSYIYWQNIVLVAAAAVAICFFLAFYLGKSGNAAAGFAVIPLSIALSMFFARFFHWYSRTDSYQGFFSAMTDYTSGGYALTGVFLGCFLAAALARLVRLSKNLPEMLDCMSVAGAAGICVGRLSSLFNSSDRGQVLASFKSLPFAYPVTNAVSGATEYRLAVFMLQAIVALILFLILALFYRKERKGRRNGDTCVIFLLCYGASQAVLDSARYDSLFFRSNGFVSIVQVLGAVALVGGLVYFSVGMVKNKGFRFWYVPLWLLAAAALGGAGYMEYYVQRHGSTALISYTIMSLCLALAVATALVIWKFARASKGKERNSVR